MSPPTWRYLRRTQNVFPCHPSARSLITAFFTIRRGHKSLLTHYRSPKIGRSRSSFEMPGRNFHTSAIVCRQRAAAKPRKIPDTKSPSNVESSQNSEQAKAEKIISEMKARKQPFQKLRIDSSLLLKKDLTSSAARPINSTNSASSVLDELWAEHNTLTDQYYKKVRAEDSVLWLKIADLKGVSAGSMSKWSYPPSGARNSQRVGIVRQHGIISDITSRAENASTRQRLTEWDENSCKHLSPLFDELVALRAKIAQEAGYRSFMELRGREKMMSPRSVSRFLDDLRTTMKPFIQSNINRIIVMKQKDGNPGELHWGEVKYYLTKEIRKKAENTEVSNFAGYFPLEPTVGKILDHFGHVFGIVFAELKPTHQFYNVVMSKYYDSGRSSSRVVDQDEKPLLFYVGDPGSPLGVLVLDLLERPGKLLNAVCRSFANITFKASADEKPALAILAKFSRPSREAPSLLNLSNLETLFHELGHAVQYFVRGGWEGLPWDAVEIASTLSEHWVRDPRILKKISSPHYTCQNEAFAKHWKSDNASQELPPKHISQEIMEDVVLMKHPANIISQYQMLLWQSKFDLQIHSYSEKELKGRFLSRDCHKILREWAGVQGLHPETNHSYLHWTILENYSTSVYCYLVAEVYAADIFRTFFARDPSSRKQGLRFRKMFLEHKDYAYARRSSTWYNPVKKLWLDSLQRMFGISETMAALTRYMGRRPNSKAFVKLLNSRPKRRVGFWARVKKKLTLAGQIGIRI